MYVLERPLWVTLKAHAGKATFVVRRIKTSVGLEGFCGSDESTFLPCNIYIYIYKFLIQFNSTKVFGAFCFCLHVVRWVQLLSHST